MSHRSLLLLGLLMSQSQHGYQIHDFIEKNLPYITSMKKGTAYALLDKLSKDEYIDVNIEYDGNRPPRKVYSMNAKGEQYFFHLLTKNLASVNTPAYSSEIGFMFIDHLDEKKAIELLFEKKQELKNKYKQLKALPNHGTHGVNIAFLHKQRMIEAEIHFIKEMIDKLAVTGVN